MIIGTLGTNIVSHINVNNLAHLAAIFGTSAIIQLAVFLLLFKNIVKELQ